MHLYNCLTDESRDEKLLEWDSEMTTCYSCQIKQGIWNRSTQQNCDESIPFHVLKNQNLCFLNESQVRFFLQVLNFIYLLILKFLLAHFRRMNWLRWIGWRLLIFLFNKRSFLVICLYFTWLSLSDLLHFAQLVFCLWSLPLIIFLLYKLQSMEGVHPKQFPTPKRSFIAEQQARFRRMIFFT